MARPVWTGTISFGLVNIGVGLFAATEARGVSFRQFEKGTDQRVRYKRVAEGTDREVDYDDIAKGYETESGDHVVVTQEELASVQPETSHTLAIEDFVALAEIDPIHYQKAYYLAPRGDGQEYPYALLREAMKQTGLAGIATLVMRNKEHLAAIRADGDVLVLNTMYFADEIRDPHEIADIPGDVELSTKELDTATDLIEQLSTAWRPEDYHDTHREQVLRLVEQKARGEEVDVEEPEEEPSADVIDLVSALEQSIEQARTSGTRKSGRSSQKSRSSKKNGSAQKSRSSKKNGSAQMSRSGQS
ncbi:Ku protein [Phytoactinopolyspora halophila]|uniref:non-homologous end joining protein Ku n=1 Tax=Phytoactinopolyspora halophila TaxID=1981511 RepID=UPI001314922E|nr:Ku protein [Phytoactinopolyspora halophila]